MKATVLALTLLKGLEGWSSKPYKDGAGKLTVGWGHMLKPGEQYESITKEQGQVLFDADVAEAEEIVNSAVRVPLTQGQFDALVIFVYNIGADKFLNSGSLRVLNEMKYEKAIGRMQMWNKITQEDGSLVVSNGLKRRRDIEAMVWRGEYPKHV